ncbi:MAG: hypothetical protein D6816_09285 [Bacteroidetes bacterium]|nr:MAG: hypothetical protein D6816_09285 [Bacteroidota bacterium]
MSTTYKVILSGCLEFGTQRSFDQVFKFYEHRTENYYRNDILFKAEEVFDPETFTLNIPRYINNECPEKRWKNTLNLLEYVSQYAVAGDVKAWLIGGGKPVIDRVIEPSGDKSATQAFLEGRELIHKSGMEEEAMKALNKAIDKFERHALAYERRGHINFTLRNFDDALYDFSKSIDINPNHPDAYWGRANTYLVKKEYKSALADLEKAIKTSIPHQPIFWSARRLKGEIHLMLEEYKEAIFELKLVTKRQFKSDDPNAKWQVRAMFNYGKALFEVGEFNEAVKVFDKLLAMEQEGKMIPPKEQQYYYRALAKKNAGEGGYLSDLKEAATLGSEEASAMLESLA